ncbi:MAG: hypothetical protein ACE5JP_03040 [Candidatus Bipolaricaulia bacterium]
MKIIEKRWPDDIRLQVNVDELMLIGAALVWRGGLLRGERFAPTEEQRAEEPANSTLEEEIAAYLKTKGQMLKPSKFLEIN